MSGVEQNWALAQSVEVPEALRQAVGGHPLVARLLAQRGILTPEAALAFLDPAYYTPADPAVLPNMSEAVCLLREAIACEARIRVWGDFDADGETSTAVLYEALLALGAQVDYALPARQEGHGLSVRAVEDARRDGIALLVTCDTGIEALDPARSALEAGLTLIITDHHDLPKVLPPARAVINPKMLPMGHAARELAGVGVAYMLARALLEGQDKGSGVLDALLDVVAIGLVADVATQVADVRYWIQRGLAVLRETPRPGLRALAALAGLDLKAVDEGTIGYQIGPRLNAAGRLDDATLGVRLLLTRDEAEATMMAQRLEAINRDRQARTDALTAQVEERLRQDPELSRQPAIVLDGEGWEAGVLGLVAGKLAHDYNRPVVLVAHSPERASTASARSVPGVDIHAAIASQRQYLLREGGHPMAAGFAIEREHLPAFRQGLMYHVAQQAPTRAAVSPLAIDAIVPWSELTPNLARQLARLSPFGPGNPKPLFVARAATVVRSEDVSRKRETEHRRLYLDTNQSSLARAIWFNAGTLPQPGESIDIAFHVTTSAYRGEERLDLTLIDWRPAEQRVAQEVATLVAGCEVVDWRAERDWQALVTSLRNVHRDGLVVWAEGIEPQIPDTLTRCELLGRRVTALGILTPPAEPAVLRALLAETQARLVYLLPPQALRELSANEFVQCVAGMVHVAVRARGGVVDLARMAARLGARQSAVSAALRGLEASGKIALTSVANELTVTLPQGRGSALDETAQGEEASGPASADNGAANSALQQARAALVYLLGETAAYRRFYASEPPEVVFYLGE